MSSSNADSNGRLEESVQISEVSFFQGLNFNTVFGKEKVSSFLQGLNTVVGKEKVSSFQGLNFNTVVGKEKVS